MQYILILWALTAAAGGVMYLWQDNQIKDLQLENQGLIVQVSVAEANQATAEAQEALMRVQVDQFQEKVAEIDAERVSARKQVRVLQELFNGHDFNNLLQKKPGLIQNRMQKGTTVVFQDLENAINSD